MHPRLIEGPQPPRATAAEARQTLEVTLAIEQSARTRQTVRLPLKEG